MLNTLVTRFGAEEAEASGFAALGFDPKAFIIQLITFLLVFYVLRRFVFQRIVDMLEKRRLTIEEGVNLTSKLSEEKVKLDAEIIKIRKKAREEADEIIAATHQQTKDMIKQAEEAAETKSKAIVETAHKKIEDETARARRNLEKEMVELVIEATEAVTREKLDAKKDNALINQALKGQA
ncbi:MAG: F0F1 ATP synthase subunit B [Candidatus Saccharimonadales bacterium]